MKYKFMTSFFNPFLIEMKGETIVNLRVATHVTPFAD